MTGRLAGRRVLVTRTREAAAGLVDRLHAEGAEVVVVPLLTTVPLAPPADVVDALDQLATSPAPRWVAVTSATAARLLCGAVEWPPGADIRVAAVGAGTAAALHHGGWPVDLEGRDGAAAVAATLLKEHRPASVLFPAAEGSHLTLPDLLEAAGTTVRRLVLYRTVMPPDAPRRLAAALDGGPVHAVVLSSGSTARHLVAALGDRGLPPGTAVVCIGGQTAEDAAAAGLAVNRVAAAPTAERLVEAVIAACRDRRLR